MNAHRTRIDNLRTLVLLAKSAREFTEATGLSTATVSIYLHPSSKNVVGERFARGVESRCGLPDGVMDIPGGVGAHTADVSRRFGFDLGPHVARLANLAALEKIAGGVVGLAECTRLSEARLIFLMRTDLAPYIPSADCASLEVALGMPTGSMDSPGSVDSFKASLSVVFSFQQNAAPPAVREMIRLDNFRALVESVGRREFCEATGAPMAVVNNVLRSSKASAPSQTRGNIHRFTEQRLGMPHLSMDSFGWKAREFESAKGKLQEILAESPLHARFVNLRNLLTDFSHDRLAERGVHAIDVADARVATPVSAEFCRDVESKLAMPAGLLDNMAEFDGYVADMRALVSLTAGRVHEADLRQRPVGVNCPRLSGRVNRRRSVTA